jgi:hypothetical protein
VRDDLVEFDVVDVLLVLLFSEENRLASGFYVPQADLGICRCSQLPSYVLVPSYAKAFFLVL